MTPEEIAEAKALCAKASPEPWSRAGLSVSIRDANGVICATGSGDNNAFVLRARTLLPKALTEIERLQTQVEQISQAWRDRDSAAIEAWRKSRGEGGETP